MILPVLEIQPVRSAIAAASKHSLMTQRVNVSLKSLYLFILGRGDLFNILYYIGRFIEGDTVMKDNTK